MNLNPNLVITVVFVLATFALGVLGGAKLRPELEVTQPEVAELAAETPRKKNIAPTERPFEPAHQSFSAAQGEPNLFQRKLSMTAALSEAGRDECRQLLEACAADDEMALRAISARWAELDPGEMFDYLLNNGWQFRKNTNVYRELFATWTEFDAEAAWKRSSEVAPDLRDNFQRQIIGNLLASDPERAMEFVERANSIGFGVEDQFADWSDDDPKRAAELLQALPRGNFKDHASATLARRWGETDPGAALKFASRIEAEVIRDLAKERVIGGWMETDPDAARQQIESLNGGALARLGKQFAGKLAEDDPAAAVEWANQHLEGGARADAIDQIVKRATTNRPEEAVKIAAEMPAGHRKTAAIATAAKALYKKDKAAAKAWISDLESDFERRAAAHGIATETGK